MPIQTVQEGEWFYTAVHGVSGGLDVTSPPQAVPLGAWVQADNFWFRYGLAELVKGWTSRGTTGLALQPNLLHVYETSGATALMCWTEDDMSYSTNVSGWTDINVGATAGSPNRSWAAELNGILFFGSAAGDWKWTGSGSAATVAAAPSFALGVSWANRLFCGDITGSNPEVKYSNIGDGETWDADDNITEFEEREGGLTALIPISANELIVHKPAGVWRITYVGGSVPFRTTFVPGVLGAAYPAWACSSPDGLQYIVATDNIYVWDGTSRPVSIGLPIFDQIEALIGAGTSTYHHNCRCKFDANRGVFMWWYQDPTDGNANNEECTHAYEFDPQTGRWHHRNIKGVDLVSIYSPWGGSIGSRFATVVAGRHTNVIHVDLVDHAWSVEPGTVAISGALKTGITSIDGHPSHRKRVNHIRLFTDSETPTSGSVTVALNYGDDPGNLTAGTAHTVDLASGSDRQVLINTVGRWFQMEIAATIKGKAFRLSGFEFEWKRAGVT